MTDPVVPLPPKTYTYRSQIQTRLASPGTSSVSSASIGLSSSSSRTRSAEQHSTSNEKIQLRKLNDKFLSYIERVRLFETYNHCLITHSEQIRTAQERTETKLELIKQEFDEYQQERFTREKKEMQLESNHINQIEQQVDELKNKNQIFQREHEKYRRHIVELQQQSVDVQAQTEKLRFDYENLSDDNQHYRRHLSYYQSLKSCVLDEISRQRDLHQSTELEVEDLRMQKQITIQAHEADTQAFQIQHDNILYDLTSSFRFDGHGKNALTEMLNEIRDEYKQKDQQMRDELHRKYLHEYNQHVKKNLDRNLLENNREDLERRHLANELNSLNDNRVSLRQKLNLIQEHYKQLETNVDREVRRKKDMHENYDELSKHLRLSIREYENLLNDSTSVRSHTLEDEVNKYRQLLEGSDQQLGLRQLVHMPPTIDQSPSTTRSVTPPPPPRPPPPPPPPAPLAVNPPQSITNLLLLQPSRTRQSSTSEVSFATAPVSQSSTTTVTTTNQHYHTLDVTPRPAAQPDYDTDNDQSQTIQYRSGRSSRLASETETVPIVKTPTNQESLPPFPPTDPVNLNETVVEIPIDVSFTDGPINQTLPFIPMHLIQQVETEDKTERISEGQQSPLISTLEQRGEDQQTARPSTTFKSVDNIIPITIDINSKPSEEVIITKVTSPSTPTMSVNDASKTTVSPKPVIDQSGPEPPAPEVPAASVSPVNPLAKLISQMLPNVASFTPSSNVITHGPLSPSASMMNNDAIPFIPGQHQMGGGQQHMGNLGGGHWGARGGGGGGGNRRGQSGGGGYHHGGGGNQRSGGGGGNWQSGGGGGGGHPKQRRGPK